MSINRLFCFEHRLLGNLEGGSEREVEIEIEREARGKQTGNI